MSVLHLMPSDSSGGSMRQALKQAGSGDRVVAMMDDLSCGPIASNATSERAEWWSAWDDRSEVDERLNYLWDQLASTDAEVVLWFSRYAAGEHAFFHACADRLAGRPFSVVDVAGLSYPKAASDGVRHPVRQVSQMNPEFLRSLLGQEQLLSGERQLEAARHWQQLRAENAPFRVATQSGLVSAPIDHFDPWILEHAGPEPKRILELVGEVMGAQPEPYWQVGNVMLADRVKVLVQQGDLLTEDDPSDMYRVAVRRPG